MIWKEHIIITTNSDKIKLLEVYTLIIVILYKIIIKGNYLLILNLKNIP